MNDIGLDIGNARGFGNCAGLFTPQAKLEVPAIAEKLDLQFAAGYFLASKKRNGTTSIGAEVSGQLRVKVADHLHWEAGAAYAALGDFFRKDNKNPSSAVKLETSLPQLQIICLNFLFFKKTSS